MTRSTNPTLDMLLQLKALGVSKFAGALPGEMNPISVEFFPTPDAPPLIASEPALPPGFGEPARCNCSHLKDSEHSAKGPGLCYYGCPVSLCHPTSTANPESVPVTG